MHQRNDSFQYLRRRISNINMILSKKQDVEDWDTINTFQEIGKYCTPKLQEVHSFLMYWNNTKMTRSWAINQLLANFRRLKSQNLFFDHRRTGTSKLIKI